MKKLSIFYLCSVLFVLTFILCASAQTTPGQSVPMPQVGGNNPRGNIVNPSDTMGGPNTGMSGTIGRGAYSPAPVGNPSGSPAMHR